MSVLVMLIIHQRPVALRGKSLTEVLDLEELWPVRLRTHLQHWRSEPQDMYRARPIVVFATIGQGRADGKITPEEENTVLGKLLNALGADQHLGGRRRLFNPATAG